MEEQQQQQSKKGRGILYLVPVPLSTENCSYLPAVVLDKAPFIKYYFVEKLKTARRFLKVMNAQTDIDGISFSEMNGHRPPDTDLLREWLQKDYEIGIMSEAGCPGVADPGATLVAVAHEMGARVIPLSGPNAMLMALMASGLNGQCFRFLGYLPLKQPARAQAIKELEKVSASRKETQIFMETPYRNNQLIREVVDSCRSNTLLGISADLTASSEFVATKSIQEWKKNLPDLHKRPAVFTLLSQ